MAALTRLKTCAHASSKSSPTSASAKTAARKHSGRATLNSPQHMWLTHDPCTMAFLLVKRTSPTPAQLPPKATTHSSLLGFRRGLQIGSAQKPCGQLIRGIAEAASGGQIKSPRLLLPPMGSPHGLTSKNWGREARNGSKQTNEQPQSSCAVCLRARRARATLPVGYAAACFAAPEALAQHPDTIRPKHLDSKTVASSPPTAFPAFLHHQHLGFSASLASLAHCIPCIAPTLKKCPPESRFWW